MLHSRNVTLRRSSDAPLRRLRDAYGSEDGAESLLEQVVLAGERRVKGHESALTSAPDTLQLWSGLEWLLTDLSAYGALGKMGGADPHFCQRVQPLLTRLMKCVLSGGFEVAVEEDEKETEEDAFDVECLIAKASKALANCGEGVARRSADTTLEVYLTNAQHVATDGKGSIANATSQQTNNTPCADGDVDMLQVCFGFADYTSGETGALLWAGAVGLSLYLVENFNAVIAERARDTMACTGRPLRVVELGCGPALVSLVLAAMAARETAAVPCRLDVTDVSPTVVEEAQRSFRTRNGAALAAMVVAKEEEEESTGKALNTDASCVYVSPDFTVRPFILDFSDIPDELNAAYDVVVASDVVYDHAIAAHVAPALEKLLKPGGVALLCCEAHRDGMSYFTDRIRVGQSSASHLRVVEKVRDVQTVLAQLQMLCSLTASTCSLMRIEKAVV